MKCQNQKNKRSMIPKWHQCLNSHPLTPNNLGFVLFLKIFRSVKSSPFLILNFQVMDPAKYLN